MSWFNFFHPKPHCTKSFGRGINADIVKNEITAHSLAALEFKPDVRTVLEIGGQDSKIIILRDGVAIDFAMNTVCAAGTGRFLEVMAKALEINLEQFQDIFIKTKEKVDITSTCTVFAESEIVSLIGKGIDKNKIIKQIIIPKLKEGIYGQQ